MQDKHHQPAYAKFSIRTQITRLWPEFVYKVKVNCCKKKIWTWKTQVTVCNQDAAWKNIPISMESTGFFFYESKHFFYIAPKMYPFLQKKINIWCCVATYANKRQTHNNDNENTRKNVTQSPNNIAYNLPPFLHSLTSPHSKNQFLFAYCRTSEKWTVNSIASNHTIFLSANFVKNIFFCLHCHRMWLPKNICSINWL